MFAAGAAGWVVVGAVVVVDVVGGAWCWVEWQPDVIAPSRRKLPIWNALEMRLQKSIRALVFICGRIIAPTMITNTPRICAIINVGVKSKFILRIRPLLLKKIKGRLPFYFLFNCVKLTSCISERHSG